MNAVCTNNYDKSCCTSVRTVNTPECHMDFTPVNTHPFAGGEGTCVASKV